MFVRGFNPDHRAAYTLDGVPPGHDARVLADMVMQRPHKVWMHVALDDMRAALLQESLAFFAPQIQVLPLPAWDCLPYDRVSPRPEIVSQRITTLTALSHRRELMGPVLVITTVNALLQQTIPPHILEQASLRVEKGDRLPIDQLRRYCALNGYVPSSVVREAGEFAVRGGIVDIFPAGYLHPIRLDYFGDDVESLRSFDALTQTTIESQDVLALSPASEALFDEKAIAHFRARYRELFGAMTTEDPLYEAVSSGHKFTGLEHWLGLFYPKMASLFDYIPDAVISFDAQADEAMAARTQQIDDFYQARLSLYQSAKRGKNDKAALSSSLLYKPAPRESLYLSLSDVEKNCAGHAVIRFAAFLNTGHEDDSPQTLHGHGQKSLIWAEARSKGGDTVYTTLHSFVKEQWGQNKRVVLACYSQGSAERIAGILRHHGFDVVPPVQDMAALKKGDVTRLGIILLGLEQGFISPDLVVITEQDLLGDRLTHAPKKRRQSTQFHIELGQMNVGDYVVHADHGIGRYDGLVTLTVLNTPHDCVKLIYDGGDKLFLPVENLDLLSRYADGDAQAALDKLGGLGWQTRTARVKKRLKDMAEALMKIAAARALKEGEVVTVDPGTYQEFAARFPYAETEDQLRAIESVFEDMASGKPMDRLVCGDVGFGKTEVALRAAFAAVMAGMQVAVVAPTTLLARQHYNNFVGRFRGFPVRIAALSRMVSAADQREAHAGLKDGRVNIVIGTHALLAKDIAFQNLGLLVIDEEQHFGVKQKERMKELRADVHVLTLTATPIPRTLQLALAGVRELSLITTPPLDRLAVRTFVSPYDPVVIREAIMREHYRGGQSFYVCPRIEDLTQVAEDLRELIPEVKMVIAHGRMGAAQLDEIMTAFDARQYDVLLATNIIESGIDIPNANTMIIHRADMFGLAQLYQLRGRVGRGKVRGYAYLTYAATAALSETAQKRLEVIETLDQLGAGFQLASHDMDIRGAGNLLGEEQSGHIREVGVELYQKMLEDAVEAARLGLDKDGTGTVIDDAWTPQINLGISVLIPETYVTDLSIRLGLYRRLAECPDETGMLDALGAEMIDRFGPLPQEVENLFDTMAIKHLCRRAGIEKIDAGPKGIVIAFRNNNFARPERLIAWLAKQAGTAKVTPEQKIVLLRAWPDAQTRLTACQKTLEELAQMAV